MSTGSGNNSTEARLNQDLETIIHEGTPTTASRGGARTQRRQTVGQNNRYRNRRVAGERANLARIRAQGAARGYVVPYQELAPTMQPLQTQPQIPMQQPQVTQTRRRTVLIKSRPQPQQQQMPANVFNLPPRRHMIRITKRKLPPPVPQVQPRRIPEPRVVYAPPPTVYVSDPAASSIPPRSIQRSPARRPRRQALVRYSSRQRYGNEVVYLEEPPFTPIPEPRQQNQPRMVYPVSVPTPMPIVYKYLPSGYQGAYNFAPQPAMQQPPQYLPPHPLQRSPRRNYRTMQPQVQYTTYLPPPNVRSPRQKFIRGYRF
ncbi:hypothetical protein Pelo_11321 [Pelomyxa schiedti]|nr:hypothetical protein Pelo_11321 [Pelomyxa schiedti]